MCFTTFFSSFEFVFSKFVYNDNCVSRTYLYFFILQKQEALGGDIVNNLLI